MREQELEQRFGTSRSPIREALRLLELSGLVTHVQRKGFRVTLYSETQIRHLYLLRAELEAYCIRQVAEMGDLAPLVAELRDYEEVVATALTRRDVRAYIGGLREFYLAGARHTGNAPLASTLAAVRAGRAAALPAGAPVDGAGGIHGYTSASSRPWTGVISSARPS